VKERPILFSGPMIPPILSDLKTQTRRIVKGNALGIIEFLDAGEEAISPGIGQAWHEGNLKIWCAEYPEEGHIAIKCPYGKPGDRLWVRETFWHAGYTAMDQSGEFESRYIRHVKYCAEEPVKPTIEGFRHFYAKRPSIHMPRWASRITLEITNVRVERLQNISEEDAKAEGVHKTDHPNLQNWPWLGALHKVKGVPTFHATPKIAFKSIWNSINGANSWEANPWVWVLEFKRL
jgi:hypothetical protein